MPTLESESDDDTILPEEPQESSDEEDSNSDAGSAAATGGEHAMIRSSSGGSTAQTAEAASLEQPAGIGNAHEIGGDGEKAKPPIVPTEVEPADKNARQSGNDEEAQQRTPDAPTVVVAAAVVARACPRKRRPERAPLASAWQTP